MSQATLVGLGYRHAVHGHHAHYAMDIRRWVAAQRGTVTASVHTTVASNVAQYSKQDVKDARAARQTLRCFVPSVRF